MAKKYKLLFDCESLECINSSTNTDKVYHVGVLERTDGTYDVVSLHGRRGQVLRNTIYPNFTSVALAVTAMNKKFREKLRKGYQSATHLYSKVDVWEDWVDSVVITGKESNPPPPKPTPPKKKAALAAIKIVEDDSPGPDTWFW